MGLCLDRYRPRMVRLLAPMATQRPTDGGIGPDSVEASDVDEALDAAEGAGGVPTVGNSTSIATLTCVPL